MIEVFAFRIEERPDLAAMANQIRQHVFVEEQNVDPALEYDEYEALATHYILSIEDIAVATARWRETPNGIKLERFATLAEHRNRGLGDILLEQVLKDTKPFNKKIYLHSQLKAIPFYERHGFIIKGEQFSEAEIDHFKMELENRE
jgi:predicted GNAT family N-acyltransferase